MWTVKSEVSLIKKHSQVAGLKNRIRTSLPFQTTGAQGYNRLLFSSVEMCCFIHFPSCFRRMVHSRCFLPNILICCQFTVKSFVNEPYLHIINLASTILRFLSVVDRRLALNPFLFFLTYDGHVFPFCMASPWRLTYTINCGYI